MHTPLRSFLLICTVILMPLGAWSKTPDDLGGSLQAEVNGKQIHFPALRTDIKADIQGDVATVTVQQVFENPTSHALNAEYLFPLNQDAAVYAMTMEVGDETIEAKINRIEEAQKTFDTAKRAGKAAALLTQHRPNMFTQQVANLMPGLPVKVTLRYTQAVPKIDGLYELVVPLIVGPRYQPGGAGVAPADNAIANGTQHVSSTAPYGTWEMESLPAYPDVAGLTIPDTIDKERVSMRVNLHSALPVNHIASDTHNITIQGGEQDKIVTLANGRTIDNRDFVLRYQLSGEQTAAGVLTAKDTRGGFFSLMIEPPAAPKEVAILPREMVFVLDTSGSMSGEPMDASKTFMKHAMRHLRPNDYFRIIRFSSHATEYSSAPVPATPEHIAEGLVYVDSLRASGGTEVPAAIKQAFSTPAREDTLRIVVFLTDGYIGNEATVLEQIQSRIGKARIYAFGVGTSVNRFLLEEMGRAGRGFARFIDPTENAEDVAIALASKLESPILTDVSVDWGDMPVSDITPSVIPDLFAGDSIRIQGRFEGTGDHLVKVSGNVRGKRATMPVQVSLPTTATDAETNALAFIWARTQIADWMRQFTTPEHLRKTGISNDALKSRIIALGLEFSLVTKWTSFVAVSQKAVNANHEGAQDAQVPLPMVKGVTGSAYGQAAQAAHNSQFAGNSVPEPGLLGGLAVISAAGYFVARRRKQP